MEIPTHSHWYLLMGISIARWYAKLMWDYLLPFCLLHTTSTIILYSTYSAMSMAHTHVLREDWKSFENVKSMKQLLGLSSGLCMIWILCVGKMEHIQTNFVGLTCFGYVILIRHNFLVSMLEVLLFLCQHQTFILNYIEYEHSCHNKKNYIEIMPSSIPHQKFCFYHLPTRGRAGIKLGDADTSPTYL